MSDPQKDQGYLLPDPIEGWELICVTLKIPDTPEYRSAFRGALKSLTEWHKWQRTGDTKGSQAATYWRQIIDEHLIIEDCDVLDFLEDCDGMAKFEMCWQNTEDGWKLVYTLNDGCTYNDVKECGTSNVVYFPQPDSVVPQPPEDDEGDYPIPDVDPENRELQRCRILDGAFKWFLMTRAGTFVLDVLNGIPASAGNNIIVWLDGTTEEDPNYTAYYPRWKALYEKHYPYKGNLENAWESAIWEDMLECVVSDCLPDNLDITREVMDCISDGVASSGYGGTGEDALALIAFLVDYINSLPLSAIRNRVFRQSQSDGTPTCGECTEEPTPVGCSPKLAFKWSEIDVLDSAGWTPEIDGAPAAWSIGDADFYFVNQGTLMTRYTGGWRFTQNGNSPAGLPKLAGSIVYDFDDPFDLCDLYVRVTTSTSSGNTRMATAWAESEGGLLIPLVGKRLNIYQKGEVSLSWVGAPISVVRIKLVGTVGGGEFRFNDVTLNGQVTA